MGRIIACILAGCALGLFACGRQSSTESTGPSKILIIGVDGGEWRILDPLIDSGRTPTIKALVENGAKGSLRTLEPCVSPAIWTTVATGKLPPEHGILGFEGVPGQTMKTLPTSQMRKTKAMWNIIGEAGKKVGVVSWWATWPAETVNGFMVTDRVTYSRMEATIEKEATTRYDTYPDTLILEIGSFVQRPNDIGNDEVRRFMDLSDDEIQEHIKNTDYRMGRFLPEFKYAYQSDKSTALIGEYLLRKEMPDLFGIFFAGVDVTSHLFWHFMEPQYFQDSDISETDITRFNKVIEEEYVYADELVQRILEIIDDSYTVIVVSDHGFGATGRLPWSGGHARITPGAPIAPDGILVMKGNNIRRGVKVKDPHVSDILPTILYLMDLPIARDMPGRVLTEAIAQEYVQDHPIAYVDTYDEEGWRDGNETMISDPQRDKELLEKLRSLGYIK